MKKILLSLTMVAFFGLLMTSCGGDKKAKTTETKTTEVKKEEAPKAEAKAVKVDVSKMTANLENGKKIYSKACIACHFTGVSGAPALKADKIDKADWQKRADKGMDALMKSAINGVEGTAMTPKGTCVDCSNQDLFDAIAYMYKEAGATIK